MANLVRLFYMAVWRNWLDLKAYQLNFVFGLLSSILFGLSMLLFALALDVSLLESTVGTTNWVAFLVLGFSYQSWQGLALWEAASIARHELTTGQIDYTFTSLLSRYGYIVTNLAAEAVQSTLFFLPMFAVGLWFTRETLSLSGLLLGLGATLLAIGALSQIGACFAALVLRHQQTTSVFSFFNFAFQFLTGMFIPLQLLPAPVRLFGIIVLPQTAGIDLLRHYVMGTATLYAVPYEWAVLVAQFVVLALIARVTVAWLERAAREQGLHYI